jgi:MFS family permease
MWTPFAPFTDAWKSFSNNEKRNIVVYITGIMLYKFGLDGFNGSAIALAVNNYDFHATLDHTRPRTFEKVGLMVGINQILQCVGSILTAPIVTRFPAKNVLSIAVIIFGLFVSGLLVLDTVAGGYFNDPPWKKYPYGHYGPESIIVFYSLCGLAQGKVELTRRVIPRDIVGNDIKKL